ncbi:MAG: glutamine synthetase III [Solobacterium sp.]|nr:glutamine synthetase III [Solobacterium sp.]MBQ9152978.1 glutamine synthetase III [Solobacterium sp.]
MSTPFEDFGSMIFGEKEMQERLPHPIYSSWKKTVSNEGTLDRATADAIAHAMKRWALEKGATHFTHWFQPMTGSTAEKHDSFIDPDDDGEPITRFSGKALIKGEPDASSFPSGGLRATFEARGYTYWDVTSPVFIREGTLCIPTVFVSYNGESLDKKDPLLKSVQVLSEAATHAVNLLGDKDVRFCTPMVGLEQEYFLIDAKDYEKREDLRLTGRTLFGAPAPKGQELGDHYFGSIPARVRAFMDDVNHELWRLGIYAKTEHNEVAPGQFELACVFKNVNIAVDQNQLVMDVLRKSAAKNGLACLLHEKPFDGINGSGKHNNFSIVTDTGLNLFAPGDKPAENIRFLVFVCAFIKAVDTYPELLRLSASGNGNDHRLGADEAPPAIISIYLGSYIENILYNLHMGRKNTGADSEVKDTFSPISGLSYIPHDNTDRNRTSPVAFTGNKFEFRMLGSSMSASFTNTVLNCIVADALNEISAELEGIKYLQDVRAKAIEICRDIIEKHKRILFSGDGYSAAWVKEAARRGLPNISCTVDAIKVFDEAKTTKLFTSLSVYTAKELEARRTIMTEQYCSLIGIEAKTLLDVAKHEILPAITKEWQFYSNAAAGKNTPVFVKDRTAQLQEILDGLYTTLNRLEKDYCSLAAEPAGEWTTAKDFYDKICPEMKDARTWIDRYEAIASDEFYRIPTYRKMLFALA